MKPKPLLVASRQVESIHLVRVVERRIGAKRFLFWTANGQTFTGRACHMHALAAARRAAQAQP